MQTLLIVLTIIGACYFGFAKRRFDLFTAAFAGCFIYFSPGYFGVARYPSAGVWHEIPIADETYAVMIVVMAAVILAAVFGDVLGRERVTRQTSIRENSLALWLLFLLASLSLLTMLATSADALFSSEKQDMLDGVNRSLVVFEVCVQVGLCLAVMARRRGWVLVFFCFIAFDVYIGFRVAFAMAAGAIIISELHALGKMRLLLERKAAVVAILLCVALVLVLKGYMGLIKAGNLDYVVESRMDLQSVLRPIYDNESFVVATTMNELILQRYDWDFGFYLLRAAAAVVPMSHELLNGVPPFAFQDQLFPEVGYGMASTIWGEAWVVGGWPFLVFFIAGYCGVVVIANRTLFRFKAPLRATLLVALAYWTLYIHRNSLEFQLVSERRFVLVALLLWLVQLVYHEFSGARNLQTFLSVQPGPMAARLPRSASGDA